MNIAIIGTGISGLGAAYTLKQNGHDITVYEKNSYLGGHSRTIEVEGVAVDTGFIVFNKRNYHYLVKLFDHLGVAYEKSDMSFGASISNGWMEYGSKNIFAQRRNLFRLQFWCMLLDILKFNKRAVTYLEKNNQATLKECLDDLKMGLWFRNYYLQAMGAAIWSCSVDTILKFPAAAFIRFFDNHGLLTIKGHPQWYTVTGGSRAYVKKISAFFANDVRLNCGAVAVQRIAGKIEITDEKGNTESYDRVLFASHADETLALLKDADETEQEILGAFTYQSNQIIVHSDESFMPRHKAAWASWIYLSEGKKDEGQSVSLSYWMNNLQNLKCERIILVTLNPGRMPDESMIHDRHHFTHPVFTQKAVAAQSKIPALQGHRNCYYAGAYQRYGFHEDGLMSAVNALMAMGEKIAWI